MNAIRRTRLVFLSLVAAMAGFLFGYDTAVINGGEQQIQQVWGLSGAMHGWVMSSALWGTVIGALSGGRITDRFGRKMTLFGSGVLYLVSAVWSGLAIGPWDLMFARFIGGIGVGVSSIAAPVYIAEIAPAEHRGLFGGLFQLNIVLGMVSSQFVNWRLGTAGLGDAAWRWMLGAEAFPAFAFTLLCPFLVESPKWLQLRTEVAASPETGAAARLFRKRNAKLLFLACSIAAFDQLSGINAVMYFAKRVFEMAGFSGSRAYAAASLMSVLLGLGTLFGLWLVDRIGRRRLLLIGAIGCVVCHFATAAAFRCGLGGIAAVAINGFIVFYAAGQGVVMWVFVSELFPTALRAQGQSSAIFVHWTFAAAITFVFPLMAGSWSPAGIFGLFGGCLMLLVAWAVFLMPETKGKELE